MRVGGTKSIQIDIRVIAATNKNLRDMVDHGLFREDLYYRLNVFPLHILPLRQRPDDILPLAREFLKQLKSDTTERSSFQRGAAAATAL